MLITDDTPGRTRVPIKTNHQLAPSTRQAPESHFVHS